ncbi:MAG: hypothetical protein K9L82_19820 [Chromatiaceae bacterium]|nr:hypothetical protein [Chromatiaceae bacterium]MCF7995683.1 hypothetical protein [Chromatiaceae bacterium]MCF8014641.1 hypothetical protein [Chromatiaceae bacterium]
MKSKTLMILQTAEAQAEADKNLIKQCLAENRKSQGHPNGEAEIVRSGLKYLRLSAKSEVQLLCWDDATCRQQHHHLTSP